MTSPTLLYLVPTPIGNLDDITLRAIAILKSVDLILAEDTRNSGKLLKHHTIQNQMQSFHAHNEHKVFSKYIDLLKEGKKIALITDAGTPGISDPGFLLAREAVAEGIKIECLPGATAFVPALVKSGLPSDKFVFEGFLPHKKGRQTRIQLLAEEERTVVLYESPHRLLKSLTQFKEVAGGERIASVSRELTKIYEETITDSLDNLIKHFTEKEPKGEIVLILSGKIKK